MERGTLSTRGARIATVLLAAALLATGTALVRAHASHHARRVASSGAGDIAPADGTRIRVEVLNATTTRGLARRVVFALRARGFDVVGMGNAPAPQDSTVVLDRSNHPDWARRVADALGSARVEARPDSSRYLDITVVLGRLWRPPAQPFDP